MKKRMDDQAFLQLLPVKWCLLAHSISSCSSFSTLNW